MLIVKSKITCLVTVSEGAVGAKKSGRVKGT